ncbi:cation:proton antiporter [Demequina sp. SYSU T00039]|uniref:Cation:proton antiporter n=1 Tax=Demequina lignilytica TaxID=3051663 RepID=A0AAW7M3K5_9MICO|nr:MULTISPECIES: cation:proton antiporter [unclassified Demequina]MDN4478531.1 cation:proton antiporter [Demequina sp. SYSU T00039-1]MDN4486962.1 cation:proton antiporter [Demequina sp. SYSU T00039]MDN4489646.1 cation:proton antiporter [Demequina sp. SYSU T00068]
MDGAEGLTLATIAGLIVTWALVGRRLERAGVTAPMAFIVAGMALAATVGDGISATTIHLLAEITLVMVLFHDASTVRLSSLRHDPWIAVRLLAVGFPLAVLLATGLTWLLIPALGGAGALLVGAAVSATDASLGAPTVLNPAVPERVRRALNVESGLNDGLATPIVMVALGVLVDQTAGEAPAHALDMPRAASGVAVGVSIGLLAAVAMASTRRAGFSDARARSVGVLALPLLTFGFAELAHGNVFLAAFVAGLTFGAAGRGVEREPEVSEALEIAADVMGMILWFLAGGMLVLVLARGFEPVWLLIAVLALTMLRLLPVALALVGAGVRTPTVLFIGWFGPRGVATIVFGLLAADALGEDPRRYDIAGIFALTVLISVFAHGLSAPPLTRLYARWSRPAGDGVGERV